MTFFQIFDYLLKFSRKRSIKFKVLARAGMLKAENACMKRLELFLVALVACLAAFVGVQAGSVRVQWPGRVGDVRVESHRLTNAAITVNL